MTFVSVPARRMTTARLLLRPTGAASDAMRAFEIQSDWNVTRMLAMASFPPQWEEISRWFADHPREWVTGEAYRFGVELQGRLIGVVDIDEIGRGEGELGYWFERASWGQGYASEAAQAVLRFAICDVGLSRLQSGHAFDNPASEKVLLKLGFRPVGTVRTTSRSRGEEISQRRYILTKPIGI